MSTETNISKCGSHCHLCPAYIGNNGSAEDRLKGSQAWERYFGLHFKPEVIRCNGCQCADPWKTGNLLPARTCSIRSCAMFNGLETCANCIQFPCAEYSRHVPGQGLREIQEKARGLRFSDQEYQENIEPFEGARHLEELHKNMPTGQIKPPKNPTEQEIVVDFPVQTSLTPADRKDSLRLHGLLSEIVHSPATTYIEHLKLNRDLPRTLALLWSLALYSTPEGDHLVLNSQDCKDKKECTRFVRKTDNRLHTAVQESADKLAERGLIIHFTPNKKEWQMTLEAGPLAGGTGILRALVYYVKYLAATHGEPIYAGSFDFKGKAFKLFSRVDMRGL